MKTSFRALAVLTALILLIPTAVYAQEADDWYAPIECDAGAITIESVAALAPDGQADITLLQTVLVTLQVPTAFLADITDLRYSLGMDFFIVYEDNFDIYFPGNIIRGSDNGNTTALTLVFHLPANTFGWNYYFVYLEQMRLLATTGEEPVAFTTDTADTAAQTDSEPSAADASADGDALQQAETEAAAAQEEQTDTQTAVLADADASAFAAVLAALDEPLYTATYESLAAGGVIAVDDRSDDAKGLQTLLNAFGYSLTTDGWAGSKTFEKLNELRGIFGMETSDSIDADGFAYLLQCLLLCSDAELAQTLLADNGISSDEYMYLLGCCAQQQGLYYTAVTYFAQSAWADSAQRAASVWPWPATGEIYHNPDYTSSRTSLEIIIETQAEGYAMLFKLYTSGGELVSMLFADGSTTVATNVPGGVYQLRAGMGDAWYGPLDAFGDNAYYEIMLFGDDETEFTMESGYTYQLTINTATLDPESDDVNSLSIDRDAF